MHLPHFGQTDKDNAIMKKLILCFHGGFLWFDMKVSVNSDLIARIAQLPKVGVDPSQYFFVK